MSDTIDLSNFDAVSFDAGETLLRPYPSFTSLFRRVCKRNGFGLGRADAARIDEVTARRLVDYQRKGITVATNTESSRDFWLGLYRDFLSEAGAAPEQVEALPKLIYNEFVQSTSYRLFADARPALIRVKRRGLKVGVLSNWEEWLHGLLASLKITPLLDFVVVSGTEGWEKPDPQIFAAAAKAAGVPANRMLHVGDSVHHDVRGAQAAGLTPVLLDRHERHPEVAALRITSLRELAPPVGESRHSGPRDLSLA